MEGLTSRMDDAQINEGFASIMARGDVNDVAEQRAGILDLIVAMSEGAADVRASDAFNGLFVIEPEGEKFE
jgi:hypothetical protein